MWLLLVLILTPLATADDELSKSVIHELELSTFYADCSVYDDPKLFGGPVCGRDGNTYANCVHLACLNHWREPKDKVQQLSKGECQICEPPAWPWSPVYTPICGTDNKTYANVEAMVLHNDLTGEETLIQYEGMCNNPTGSVLCVDPSGWKDAVCATNGRTYPSVTAVADMRRFGQCLDVLHDGGCTVDEVKARISSREQICDMARNLYEYNPVCDMDGVTYANPYIFLCFRPTSKVQYMGECNSPMHVNCQAALDIESGKMLSPGPVCASDGLTYASLFHLNCAKNNDRHLTFLHNGTCEAGDSPCIRMPQVADGGAPVCGSDKVTYINSYALWCMQRKEDPSLRYFHDGPCFRQCVECNCVCSWA